MERDPVSEPVGMDVCATNPQTATQTDQKENKDDVATAAATDTNANATPAVEDKEFSFVYLLRNYRSTDRPNKIYSDFHSFGGFKWRLLIFPRGNQTTKDLSVYLECGGPVAPDDDKRADAQVSEANDVSLARNQHTHAHIHAQSPVHTWTRPAHFYLHLVHPGRWAACGINLKSNAASGEGTEDVDVDVKPSANAATPASTQAPADGDHEEDEDKNIPSDIVKDTAHVFRERESDWGFCEFASFSSLSPGQHSDDHYNVVIKVRIRLDDAYDSPHNISYDSRKQTGYVGFKNQGATCYMNSLLQTLYMLVAFRKAVYEMPLPDPENTDSDMTYALQKVFYELQFSPTVVKTKKLTESFGWETTDAFTQHDVQELNRILCDHLEEKMKKTDPDKPNKIQELFQGKILNYIECVDVDFKSTREESFYDLSLNVKGCRNIFESFDKYTEVETMDGDNKYRADGFAELQRARKGVTFRKLPPVLQLHLKRFEYDFHRDAMVKINDRYEFDTEIDLSDYVDESDGSDIYVLHSVLVHIGDVNGGHYHAFIRTTGDDKSQVELNRWLKFDDEHVSIAKEQEAVVENFGYGGEKDLALITANNGLKRGKLDMDDDITNIGLNGQTHPPALQPRTRNLQSRRFMNAYMLQYIRKDAVPTLLGPLSEGDIPEKLAERISKERAQEEQRRKEILEQHLYMVVAIATDEDLERHHAADLTDWEGCKTIRIKRAMSLGEFKMQLQNEKHIRDASKVRIWKCTRKQSDILRPDTLVADGDDSRPMADSAPRDVLHNNYMYNTRYNENYTSNEEPFRIFIEDLESEFCYGVGESVMEAKRQMEKEKGESPMSVENGTDSAMDDGEDDAGKKGEGLQQSNKKNVADGVPDGDAVRLADGEIEANEQQEVALNPCIFPRHLLNQDEILLFFKLYIPQPIPRVEFLGHVVVNKQVEIGQSITVLRRPLERFGVSADDNLVIFEEQCSGSVVSLDPQYSIARYQLSRGDVIVLQAPLQPSQQLAHSSHVHSNHQSNQQYRRNGALGRFTDAIPEGIEHWDFRQTPARNDEETPLGGRPLPSARDFYNYLRFRVKVEFKDKSIVDNELNDINVDEVAGICLELTKCDSYATVRKILANALGNGIHPDFLRLFTHDLQRQAPAHEPLRATDTELILKQQNMHIMTPHVLASQMTRMDYRVLWYEKTEYRLCEFEHKEEVRVIWRWDGGARATSSTTTSSSTVTPMVVQTASAQTQQSQLDVNSMPNSTSPEGGIGIGMNGAGVETSTTSDDVSVDDSATDSTLPIGEKDVASPPFAGGLPPLSGTSATATPEEMTQLFSVLVPPLSKYTSVIDGIRRRQRLDSNYPVRLLEVRLCRIERIIDAQDVVPHSIASYDFPACLRAEPVLPDETIDALGDEFTMVAVAHVAKQQHRGARSTFFGTPFLIRVKNAGMPVAEIRETIRAKMMVDKEEFDTWRLAEVLTTSLSFLTDDEVVWSPEPRATFNTELLTTLAIEHRAPTPRRYNSANARFADKPLKIRG